MTCQSCQAAEQNPLSGLYSHDCEECKARMLANSRELFTSAKLGYMSKEYKSALIKAFGADRFEDGHKLVKMWMKRIKEARLK